MLTTLETTPEPEVPARDEFARPDDVRVTPPRRSSNNDPEPISPSEHSFVKTTFGKRTFHFGFALGASADQFWLSCCVSCMPPYRQTKRCAL